MSQYLCQPVDRKLVKTAALEAYARFRLMGFDTQTIILLIGDLVQQTTTDIQTCSDKSPGSLLFNIL